MTSPSSRPLVSTAPSTASSASGCAAAPGRVRAPDAAGPWPAARRVRLQSSAWPAGATPPLALGLYGPLLVEDLLDVALGHLQAVLLEVGGQLPHGEVLKLFGAEPVQVLLDALTLGRPGQVATVPNHQAGLSVLPVFRKVVACRDGLS